MSSTMQAATVPSILSDYLPLVLFIGVSAVIGLALLIAPFAIAYSKPEDVYKRQRTS